MKQLVLFLLLVTGTVTMTAQTTTTSLTVYQSFQPATIHLVDGKQIKVGFANIFLKNSGLLYMSGQDTKEANLKTLSKVEFKDRTYYRIDSVLAYQVDTVNHQPLYCAQRIDVVAWRGLLINNRQLSNINLGDMITYSATTLADQQDIHFPLINVYYLQIDGKYVLAHERNLKRVLDKEKRRLMASVMSEPGFSWTSEASLLKLLKYIQ
jgi:hypothetical protein